MANIFRLHSLIKLVPLILFINSFDLQSQSSIDNEKAHRRYWYYRTRLINDFMKLGTNQGESIVFAERNALYISKNTSVPGPDQIDLINMYIMTLCLEYKILSRGNQDVSETVSELYNLLYTINRLDLEAEQFWDSQTFPPGPSSEFIMPNGTLNGFMLREDMPKNFINNTNNLAHFNYEINLNGNPNVVLPPINNVKSFCGMDYTNDVGDSKFSGHFWNSISRDEMFMPQDKYHTLLLAMMFVQKYIPGGVSYSVNNQVQYFQDGAFDIKGAAKNIGNRAYSYCKGVNNAWKLRYLNSQNQSQGNISNSNGGDAWIYSWALSRMTCHVNHGFPFSNSNSDCANYLDINAATTGWWEYNVQCLSAGFSMDNAVFKAWDQAGTNTNPSLTLPLLPIYLTMQINSNQWKIEWSELLRKVLHQNGSLLRDLSIYSSPLDVAPCSGPYNFGNCTYGGYEWSAQDRIEHPNRRGAQCPANPTDVLFSGNYPGIDYMLLHNLYYEFQNQLSDGNNGNNNNNGGAVNPFYNVLTIIFNSTSNAANAIITTACNVANSVSNFFGQGNICTNPPQIPNISNNTTPTSPYLGYNLMDNKDENIWPRKLGNTPSSQTQGNNSFPAKVAVYQNLTSKAHIYATSSPAAISNVIPSNVTYRAGKEITLLPGFTADQGGTFHAYVQRYLCNGNSDALNMRLVGDSTSAGDSTNIGYENDLYNLVPIHYVPSPPSDSDLNPSIYDDSTTQASKSAINNEEMQQLQAILTEQYKTEKGIVISNEVISFKRFSVVPNPNNGLFKIYVNRYNDGESISVSIYDMKGAEIRRFENIYEVLEIDLTEFGKGIYLVKMFSSLMKEQELKKIIVQ